MARMPRLAIDGQPHLVIQRVNGPRPAFTDDADRRAYLSALIEVLREGQGALSLHAYALLADAVLLLATPRQADELGRFMQRVNRRYVAGFHLRHATSGGFWAGRFQSAAIEPERYLLRCVLMVEQAPVKAGLVSSATEWPWSSARHHAGRETTHFLTGHPVYWRIGNTPFEREARHELELQRLVPEEQVEELVHATRGGWPLGQMDFIVNHSKAAARPVRPRPRGRPPRGASEV